MTEQQPLTDVEMVCTACRKPVYQYTTSSGKKHWCHENDADHNTCPAVDDEVPVFAMVAAGNERIPVEYPCDGQR